MAYDISSKFPLDGLSVNEGLDQEEKTVSYAKFDEAVKMIAKCGRGALLAKVVYQNASGDFQFFQGISIC